MSRRRISVGAAVLMVLLVGTQFAVPVPSAAATPSSTAGWWNGSYQFRRSVTVTNQGSVPLVNQTVLVHLNFTGNDVEDPFSSVRLVNSTGGEVPSVIIGPQYSGPFLRSAYLLFMADLEPTSSLTYYVYYGADFQALPSYRSFAPIASFGNGSVTASTVPLSLDSTEVLLTFGSIDSESTTTGVSYPVQGAVQDYGPTTYSQAPFANDSGMISAGDLNSQNQVAYDVLQAGQLQLTRIMVLSPDSALTIDAVSNGGSRGVSGFDLTSVVGLGGLSTLGSSESFYNYTSGFLYTENPDAYFGARQSLSPSSFGLGSASTITGEASGGAFSGVDSYKLASAAGFSWDLGGLGPSDAFWISTSWGVSPSLEQLGASMPNAPLTAALGGQEVLPTATPTAGSLWSTSVTLTNLPIPSSGVVIPFGVGGASLIAGASTVSGTYAYSVPPAPQLNSNVWTSDSRSGGNGTAFASSSYYAFDIGESVERLSGVVPNANSNVTASLISTPGFAFRGTNAVLEVKYKASHSITSGNLSDQDLFVSADLDPTLTGNYSENIVLPVSGTSTTIPTSGCVTSGPTASPLEAVKPADVLIGDGTWRTLSISLPSSLNASGFNVMIRMCMSSSSGFAGSLDLEVASVGVVLQGQVSTVLQTTFSETSRELTIGYLPQASSVGSVGTVANLTISEVLLENASIGWQGGSSFSGTIAAPGAFTINGTSLAGLATIAPLHMDGVLVGSAVAGLVDSGKIGGLSGTVDPGPGVALLAGGSQANAATGTPFTVGLAGETVDVAVLDQNGAGVPGVQITPIEDGRSLNFSDVTNASGVAPIQLVPWTFQFNATYQETAIGSASIQAGAPPSVTLSSNIYNLTLAIKDSRGGVLPGAQLTFSLGNYTFSGTTNSQGRYSFEGIAGSVYSLSVDVGGTDYFNGQIGATANNVLIEVNANYLPTTALLLIVGLLALVPLLVVLGYFVARRFRKSA